MKANARKVALVGIFLFLFLVAISFLSGRGNDEEEEIFIRTSTGRDLDASKMGEVKLIEPTPWVITPELFAARPAAIRSKISSIQREPNIEEIRSRCSQFTQHGQLLDLDCAALWMNQLQSDQVVGVERMWGFEDTHYGAITLVLRSGIRAMFKPCTSKSEDTTKELIASYIDQLLGFGQTAPVVTRIIPISVVDKYCDTKAKRQALIETVDLCGVDDSYFVGPMIGWWDDLTPIRTVRKYKEQVEVLYEQRAELSDNLYTTQMQSKYHAFYLLINILRHGKDEFITKHGDLVSLDLDRSRFKSTTAITGKAINYTWCFTCYMDEWVYDTFQAVGPSQPVDNRLGMLMKDMLAHEELFQDLWDSRLAVALDTRVEMLLDCMDDCISKWGRSNVLLHEEKTMTAKELVEWFVLHSVYKKRNGQQGPSNIEEFLENL